MGASNAFKTEVEEVVSDYNKLNIVNKKLIEELGRYVSEVIPKVQLYLNLSKLSKNDAKNDVSFKQAKELITVYDKLENALKNKPVLTETLQGIIDTNNLISQYCNKIDQLDKEVEQKNQDYERREERIKLLIDDKERLSNSIINYKSKIDSKNNKILELENIISELEEDSQERKKDLTIMYKKVSELSNTFAKFVNPEKLQSPIPAIEQNSKPMIQNKVSIPNTMLTIELNKYSPGGMKKFYEKAAPLILSKLENETSAGIIIKEDFENLMNLRIKGFEKSTLTLYNYCTRILNYWAKDSLISMRKGGRTNYYSVSETDKLRPLLGDAKEYAKNFLNNLKK